MALKTHYYLRYVVCFSIAKQFCKLFRNVLVSKVKSDANRWNLDYNSQKSYGATGCIEGRGDFFQQHCSFFLATVRAILNTIPTTQHQSLSKLAVDINRRIQLCSQLLKTRNFSPRWFVGKVELVS